VYYSESESFETVMVKSTMKSTQSFGYKQKLALEQIKIWHRTNALMHH
jgi:hypothetical protein